MKNTFELTFSDLMFFYLVTFSGEIFFSSVTSVAKATWFLRWGLM